MQQVTQRGIALTISRRLFTAFLFLFSFSVTADDSELKCAQELLSNISKGFRYSVALPEVLTALALEGAIDQTVWHNELLADSEWIDTDLNESDLLKLSGIPGSHEEILSVAEGEIGLVHELNRRGASAIGVDTSKVYNQNSAYYNSQTRFLKIGNPLELNMFADESKSLVVSFGYLNRLNASRRVQLVKESFRLLKSGGTMRHALVLPNGLNEEQKSLLIQGLRQLVKVALLQLGQEYSVAIRYSESYFHQNRTPSRHVLLLVEKKAPPAAPAETTVMGSVYDTSVAFYKALEGIFSLAGIFR